MFGRILVPLDGSAQAEEALPVAARIARASGASIALVSVVRAPMEFELSLTPPAAWAPAARPEERAAAAAYLNEIRTRDTWAGLTITTGVYAGPEASMILTVAKAQGSDLIVMTSRGRTGLTRWLLGSVASEVAREAEIPTLVLRSGAASGFPETAAEGSARPLRVLVPLDGSPLAETALPPTLDLLAALAGASPVAIHLLSIIEPLPLTSTAQFGYGIEGEGHVVNTELIEVMRREASSYLQEIADRLGREAQLPLAGRSVTITWSTIYDPDIADAILNTAKAERDTTNTPDGNAQASNPVPYDLIALATHGRGGLRRWGLGSVADRVLHAATLPVLVIRPKEVPRTHTTGDGAAGSTAG